MDITSELINKIRNAESPEELVEIAKENDAQISLKDAQMIFSTLHEKDNKSCDLPSLLEGFTHWRL